MGYVQVFGADVAGGRIAQLKVKIPRIPARVIDRDTAIRWMKDGHSLLPVVGGHVKPALQLVETDDDQLFVRVDNAKAAEDTVPSELPDVASASADKDVSPFPSH